jgi:hypothetical protein
MGWFKPVVVYKVVEVEKFAPRLSQEDGANIASLENHPGFHALLARLQAQKALLKSTLETVNHPTLSDVQNLQAGIRWITWLDKLVQQQADRTPKEPRDAFELETLEFRRMAEALEFVGKGRN